MLGQLVVSGLAIGAVYALVALGLVLVFKSTDVLNFAQGDIGMFATFFAFQLLFFWKLPFPVAILAALASAAVIGIVIDRALVQPIIDAPIWTVVTLTLGVSLVLHSLAGQIWRHDPLVFPGVFGTGAMHIGDLVIAPIRLGTAAIAIGLMLILLFFFHLTKQGIAMRAMAQNRIAARLMGVRVARVFSASWAMGCVLAAVAAILVAPLAFLSPNFMFPVLFKAIAAAILGGMNSLAGAVIGGFALGIMENLVGGYISPDFKEAFAFVLIILILVVRPTGIFGGEVIKKV